MRLLHLQCLKDIDQSDREVGGLLAAAGLAREEIEVIRPFDAPAPMTALSGIDALTIGGSAWSVFDPIPHYAALSDLLREARRRGLPMFGICFGAQAFIDVFGGNVIRDEANAECGTTAIVRVGGADDPLFKDMPASFDAQSWHRDRIANLPPDGIPLAMSADRPVLQAFRLGAGPLYGVQFHPERTAVVSRSLISERLSSRPERRDALLSGIRESVEATSLVKRFLDRFARAA